MMASLDYMINMFTPELQNIWQGKQMVKKLQSC